MKNIWYHSIRFDKDKRDVARYLKSRHEITGSTKNIIYVKAMAIEEPSLKSKIRKINIDKPYLKDNTSTHLTVDVWSYRADSHILHTLKMSFIKELNELNIATPQSLNFITP